MTTQLLEWDNLIFVLPLGLGIFYLMLYTVSGWTFGDADTDVSAIDHDVDAHLDVHGELAVDQDADLQHEIHVETDHDSSEADSHAAPASLAVTILSWVGVGRMPLSLVLMILMLTWGTIGFASMQVEQGRSIQQGPIIAIAIAAVGSLLITHFIASVLGRTLFASLNISRRRHELLGSCGEALYPIDEKFGMVCGRDDQGELFQVPCRVEEGKVSVAKGAAVQLVAYSAKEGMFYVVPSQSSVTPRRAANSQV